MLLVEQNVRMALQFSQRGYGIENGTLALASSSPNCPTIPKGRGRIWRVRIVKYKAKPPLFYGGSGDVPSRRELMAPGLPHQGEHLHRLSTTGFHFTAHASRFTAH